MVIMLKIKQSVFNRVIIESIKDLGEKSKLTLRK